MEQFEFSAHDFCQNIRRVTVIIKNDTTKLKRCIQRHYDLRLNDNEKQFFKSEIDSALKIIDNGRMKITINVSLSVLILKYKICQMLDNIFDIKCIELYKYGIDDGVICWS